jgi:hypothetical protein
MASSALDMIKGALKLLNVLSPGEVPDAELQDDAFKALNRIVSSWNTNRLMLYAVKNVVGTLNAGQNPHTIGDGGDIDIDRPLRIEKCFVRVPGTTNPVDYPVVQMDNNRYQEFTIKNTLVNYPTNFYYEPTLPLASIYMFPVQSVDLEIHLSVWMQLAQFSSLIDENEIPIDYENALMYQLAIDLAPMLGKSGSVVRGSQIYDRCKEFIREIKTVNQPKYVSTIDSALLGSNQGSGAFNIYRGY